MLSFFSLDDERRSLYHSPSQHYVALAAFFHPLLFVVTTIAINTHFVIASSNVIMGGQLRLLGNDVVVIARHCWTCQSKGQRSDAPQNPIVILSGKLLRLARGPFWSSFHFTLSYNGAITYKWGMQSNSLLNECMDVSTIPHYLWLSTYGSDQFIHARICYARIKYSGT